MDGNIGDIRAQLLLGAATNREEQPHLLAAADAARETGESAVAAGQALIEARESSALATNGLPQAAAGAARAEALTNELEASLKSTRQELQQIHGRLTAIDNNIAAAANAISRSEDSTNTMQSEAETAQALADKAIDIYTRTLNSSSVDPVPMAVEHRENISEAAAVAADKRPVSQHARDDIGALAGLPDRAAQYYESRIAEAEELESELGRLATRLAAFYLSLSDPNEEHSNFHAHINHVVLDVLPALNTDRLESFMRMVADQAIAMAEHAEDVASRK
jgi:septal ring factor EnvC (AmiA/AmiB activator)